MLMNTPQGMAEFMHDGSFELRFLGILVKPAEIHGCPHIEQQRIRPYGRVGFPFVAKDNLYYEPRITRYPD